MTATEFVLHSGEVEAFHLALVFDADILGCGEVADEIADADVRERIDVERMRHRGSDAMDDSAVFLGHRTNPPEEVSDFQTSAVIPERLGTAEHLSGESLVIDKSGGKELFEKLVQHGGDCRSTRWGWAFWFPLPHRGIRAYPRHAS
jgi:hypothetical protein